MRFENIFESANKGYNSLKVIDMISDFPLVFLRMFFDEFEKKIFKINPKDKKSTYDTFNRNLKEKRNPFLDTLNHTELKFSSINPVPKKSYRDNEVEITFNVYGNKLKYSIAAGYSQSSHDMTMNISKMTTKEFLDKFIELVKIIYDTREDQRRYYGNLDTSNIDLYKQDSKIGKDINEKLSNFLISIQVEENYFRSDTKVRLKSNFDKIFSINRPGYFKANLGIPEAFIYSFQFKEFERCKNYIIGYLNRNNLWINRMDIDNYSIEIICSSSNDPDVQNKDYRDGWTYRKLQQEALGKFQKTIDDFIKTYKSQNGIKIDIETVDEFKQFIIKNSFNLRQK